MQQPDDHTVRAEQKRVARRYKKLGYDVQENPGPDRLPEFMRGAKADLVARSPSDNVIVDVKRHGSLKGSNELVDIAGRVSDHPDWRFELVVLPDTSDRGSDDGLFEEHVGQVRAAMEGQQLDTPILVDMAVLYVLNLLVHAVHDVAAKAGVAARGKDDRALLHDLAFKGVLPGAIVEQCLAALKVRDSLAEARRSKLDVEGLLALCEDVRSFP